jgi:hypothetical protein
MAKKDLCNNIVVAPFVSGEAVDLFGYNSFTFAAFLAEAGEIEFTVTESDDNTVFTEVPAEKLIGHASVENAKTAQVGYKGDCRYVKVAVSGTPEALVAVFGQPAIAPAM